MSILELLEQELAAVQTAQHRDRAELQTKIAVVQQQANLIEHKDALLSEQSTTIRKQEEKLAAQQLEINRLIQQAFGRRSERYLESPQQLKIDFGGGPEVTDAVDGLQQAVDDKQLADEAVAATAGVLSTRPAAPPKKKKKRDESLPANLPRIEKIVDVAAGARTADLMTLVSSAIRNDLHVWAYIKGVLDALLAGSTDYHSLRPDIWAANHPDHIRTYRKDERRDRADRKQRAREERRNARG